MVEEQTAQGSLSALAVIFPGGLIVFGFIIYMNKTNRKFMSMALNLARKGGNRTFPNPKVGAVVVKEGKVIGKG